MKHKIYKGLATTAVMSQLLAMPIMSHADMKQGNTSVQKQAEGPDHPENLEDMSHVLKVGNIQGAKFHHVPDANHKEWYYVTNKWMTEKVGNIQAVFYFGDNGERVKGLQKIQNKLYYFEENGMLTPPSLLALKTVNGKIYYFADHGAAVNGLQKVQNKLYYFDGDNGAIKNQQKTIDGKIYYFGDDGTATIDGIQNIDGKSYQMADGKRIAVKDSDKWYYLKEDGTEDKTPGWKTNNGKRYYIGKEGAIATGLQNVEGKDHYFGTEEDIKKGNSQTNNGAFVQLDASQRKGWNDISIVQSIGQEARGWVRTKDTAIGDGNKEVVYYAGTGNDNTSLLAGELAGGRDDKGNKINNWQTIDGNHYYFGSGGSDGLKGKDDNGLLPNEMAMGWIKVEGKDYYFSKDEDALKIGDRTENVGEMAKGIQRIQESAYYFDDSGVMAKSGWKDSNGAKYYLGTDGKAFTGLQTIDGKHYYFGEDKSIQKLILEDYVTDYQDCGVIKKGELVKGLDGSFVIGGDSSKIYDVINSTTGEIA
ncbi:hypothetical protein ER45_029875 (plasmid) [Bacillus mycoides]|nr:hypothetical protein ER45_029875 [Bacillus mycoides]